MLEIKDLKGKILIDIKVDKEEQEIIFTTNDGEKFKMYHEQNCCEGVYIEDINGDINDLLNTSILLAESSVSQDENPEGVNVPDYQDSFTWTFYKLATIKGYVDIRWYGESNGYYSESVDFIKADSEGNFSRW